MKATILYTHTHTHTHTRTHTAQKGLNSIRIVKVMGQWVVCPDLYRRCTGPLESTTQILK